MTKTDWREVMWRCSLFSGIENGQRDAFLSEVHPVERVFSKDEVVVGEGEEDPCFYLVMEGAFRAEKYHYTGDVHTVAVFEKGDIFSLDCAVSRTKKVPLTAVSSKKGSRLMLFNYDRLAESSFYCAINRKILEFLADDNIRKLEMVDILSHQSVRERILLYLNLRDKKAGGNPFTIHMTQEQFAMLLAVNRSVLSAELSKLRREGLIDFSKDRYELKVRWKDYKTNL